MAEDTNTPQISRTEQQPRKSIKVVKITRVNKPKKVLETPSPKKRETLKNNPIQRVLSLG